VIKEQLIHIIRQGENETVEFKRSFSKAVFETIIAFSNRAGGKILIGVDDHGIITGITPTQETVQRWINEIKQNTEPSIIPDIKIVEINSKKVIIVSVNEFPIKPVSYRDRFFVRKINSNHKLSASEIAELRIVSLNYSAF
jgi:ATP-dependent DNA helicase RecG